MVVIGGGPTGSQTAYQLAKRGYRVLVLEQKSRPGEGVCCTGVIGSECIRSFAVDDSLILGRVNSARAFSPSGKSLSLWLPETQAFIIDRATFDAALANRAQQEGAEYCLNSRAVNIETKDDEAIIEVLRQGEEFTIEAQAVVIASGFASRLAEGMGMGRIKHFVLGAQAEVTTTGITGVEVYFGSEVAPGFFAWLVPISPVKARLGLLSDHSPGFYLKRLISTLLVQGKIAAYEAEPKYGGVSLKPIIRTYGERLLVVGTAAGQVKPTTGGGIYYGLLCADIAADNLHRAISSNDLSVGRLAGYQQEWKKKLGRELSTGYRVRKLYQLLSDGQIDSMFNTLAENGMVDLLLKADDVSFDWHSIGLLRMLGQVVISKAVELARAPFRQGG
ncbi:MAG: NAD(P)/FAD-dependent oxidoreductase [Dehalococcoidales bacterium]|nr:NAD(P)/FAD-dependent oxidoreductase [Dehalococcoidales bacterium]